MKWLDQLVARRIMDGRGRFDRGQLARDLEELGAPREVREALDPLAAPTWEAFVRLAYRSLLDLEQALELPAIPSAIEGLRPVRVVDEQVA